MNGLILEWFIILLFIVIISYDFLFIKMIKNLVYFSNEIIINGATIFNMSEM